jgi:hypothetical protein
MNIRHLAIGTIAGLIVGGASTAASTALVGYTPPTRPNYEAPGFKVECHDNGQGRFRKCDVLVDNPTNRVDFNITLANSTGIGGIDVKVWGLNPNPNKSTGALQWKVDKR